MIKRNPGYGWELTCDICGEGEEFDYFDYALEYKKDLGWVSEKYKDEWQDICPECQEESHESHGETTINYNRNGCLASVNFRCMGHIRCK